MFSDIARQTHDKCCNNILSVTKTLPQLIRTGYMKSKLKTQSVTCIKTCSTIVRQCHTTKKKIEAVHQRCSAKKVFLNISQNSQGDTCARAQALACNFIKKETGAGVFL